MAISRFKTSTVAQGLPKYQDIWDQVTFGNPVTSGLMLNLDASNTSSYSGSGTAWNDLSGSNNNFTLSNASFTSNGAASYIGFNGTSTTGSCGNTIFGNGTTTPFTVSIWVWANGTTPDPQEWVSQWSNGNSGNSMFFGPRTLTGGTASVLLGDGQSTFTSITYPIGQWVNWVGINDVSGNKQFLYRNGTLVGTLNNKATWSGTANTLLGHQRNAGEFYNGRMAIVRAYNRAITSTEVSQDFGFFRGRFGI